MRRVKARLTDEFVPVKQTSNKEIFVHAYMKYRCEKCWKQWDMFCEQGVEEGGKNHKPSPFVIRCKCGGFARDVSGLVRLGNYYPLEENMSYFANKKDSDCGVPILR